MGGRIISVLCAVLAIVGAVFLVRGYRSYNAEQQKTSGEYEALSLRMSELESEKREVKGNILRLEKSIAEAAGSKATLNIIFTGMSEKIYTDALPVMKEHGFAGTIAMSAEELPGEDGRLTDYQIASLVGEGWDIIPRYSGGDGELGIDSAAEWIAQYGFDAKACVMIGEEELTPETEGILSAAGYDTIVTVIDGADKGAVVNDKTDGVWKPRAVGYLCDGRKDVLTDAVQSNGHVIFTVGFDEDEKDELYSTDMLSSMLSYIDTLSTKGELMCSDIVNTRSYRAQADEKHGEAEGSAKAKLEEYKAELVRIDKAIDALYKEYK